MGLALVALGCNRVPSKDEARSSPLSTMLRSSLTSDEESTAAGEASAADPGDEELPPLCGRACRNWVEVRFPDPVGYDRLLADEAQRVTEILERQRALNLAACEEACVRTGNTEIAWCVRRAMTADESVACASR